MNVALLGVGAVGARAARQLASSPEVERVYVADVDEEKVRTVVASLGHEHAEATTSDAVARVLSREQGPAVAVLAGPGRTHAATARALVEAGVSVVSVSDDV